MNIETFWSSLDKPNGDNGCWIWTRSTTPPGYGRIYIPGKGTSVYTHRLAYELVKGSIPRGMHVCHTCDNPPCCNPDHLWLGTPRDNMQDRDSKGRGESGRNGNHPTARLTLAQVQEIRALYKTGEYLKTDLGARFGVSADYIRVVVLNLSWRDPEYTPPTVFDNGIPADKDSIRVLAARRQAERDRQRRGVVYTSTQASALDVLRRYAQNAKRYGLTNEDIRRALEL